MQNLDEWLAFVSTHLPEPVLREEAADGTVWFTGGRPPLVIVTVGGGTIAVFEYAVRLEPFKAPLVTPRLVGQVKWRRARNTEMTRAVGALIGAARESRLAKFHRCEQCDEAVPPEEMHDATICQACAEGSPGVVH
jgi:hypothetical protein